MHIPSTSHARQALYGRGMIFFAPNLQKAAREGGDLILDVNSHTKEEDTKREDVKSGGCPTNQHPFFLLSHTSLSLISQWFYVCRTKQSLVFTM